MRSENNLVVTPQSDVSAKLFSVIVEGDISKLSSQEKTYHYKNLCESLGLNPLSKPFEYLKLNGKELLYARKDATDQLRKLHNISITIVSRDSVDGVFIVTAKATTPDGRHDESVGAVPVSNLKGDALANALMKAETKAKRRVTLSICGLGFLDESELETIRMDAKPTESDLIYEEIKGYFSLMTNNFKDKQKVQEILKEFGTGDHIKSLSLEEKKQMLENLRDYTIDCVP